MSTAQKIKKSKRAAVTPRPAKRLSSKRIVILYLLALLFTALCAGIAAKAMDKRDVLVDPFTASQHQAASFSLYYPSKLPEDYTVAKPDSQSPQSSVVTLRISDSRHAGTPADRSFVISQQASSPDFNFSTFLGSFEDKLYIKTKSGQATIGNIDNGRTRIASLVSDDGTWILVNAPAATPAADIGYVLQHLAKSRH